jgi:two-component system chemotaxis sensor kinase CheA
MINNLLEISRESVIRDSGFSKINMKEETENIIKFYSTFYVEKNLEISVRHDPRCSEIYGERSRILNILENLISNAMKFTEKGRVFIKTEISESVFRPSKIDLFTHNWERFNADKMLKITVKDTGIGISSKNLKYIFNPFHQADPGVKRKFGGAGIGLYLVKKSAEEGSGHIEVDSKSKNGTRFTVYMPIKIPGISGGQAT